LGKFHDKATGAEVAPELLTKQHLDIRLIVDDENEKAHAPALTNWVIIPFKAGFVGRSV
jgi:hypothetical protein